MPSPASCRARPASPSLCSEPQGLTQLPANAQVAGLKGDLDDLIQQEFDYVSLAILQGYLPSLLSEADKDRQLTWGMGVRL